MQVRCKHCDIIATHFYHERSLAFRNVNERKKHCLKTNHTSLQVLRKHYLGKVTHHYQVLRYLEKQQRPLKHGEAR